jgi:hypothetical protein
MSLKTKKEGCDASFFFIGFTDSELVQSKFLGVAGRFFQEGPARGSKGRRPLVVPSSFPTKIRKTVALPCKIWYTVRNESSKGVNAFDL